MVIYRHRHARAHTLSKYRNISPKKEASDPRQERTTEAAASLYIFHGIFVKLIQEFQQEAAAAAAAVAAAATSVERDT